MQKSKVTVKAIRLNRETLRQLSSDRLATVAAGVGTVPTCGASCNLFVVSNCGSGC
jgi:hypothetical protein